VCEHCAVALGVARRLPTLRTPSAGIPADNRLAKLARTWLPGAVVVLAGAFLLWTRLIPLDNSLWNDEIHSVLAYILPGPGGIWGSYTPNDHMLFELLSWASTKLVGVYEEPTYRLWGVVPSIAAVALMTGWSWRRLSPWVSALFATIAVTAPLFMTLSIQARGYGLGFLASVLVVIGADGLARAYSVRNLWCFAGGGLAGLLTLPTFALPFGTVAVVLMAVRPGLRRAVMRSVAVVGIVALAFYGPVLGPALSSAQSLTSGGLPWHGFITGPLVDLLAPSVQLFVAPASLTVAEVVAACVLVYGAFVLVRAWERVLALILLLPTAVTYLAFEISQATTADRFMSFLLLPLLLVAATGLAGAGHHIARRGPPYATLMVVLAVGFCAFALRRGETQFAVNDNPPIENWREAATLASQEHEVITNSYYANSLGYYLGAPIRKILDAKQLESEICSDHGAFAYVEHDRAPSPQVSTTCLQQRGAVAYKLAQLRGEITVWLVPAQSAKAPRGRS
jgi:hypothetical protein